MKNSFVKFAAFISFVVSYTSTPAQSTAETSSQAILDSSNLSESATRPAVDISDLKARKRNNAILLEWTIDNKAAIEIFEIERSDDGKKFYTLEQKPTTSVSAKTPYSYQDLNPLPVNYYRVKIIDQNGVAAYSKVVSVAQNGNFYSAVQPNPFLQNFTVQTYLASAQPIKIQLLELNGKLLRYKSVRGVIGKNEVGFDDLGSLQPGIYIVRIVRADSIEEKKIVKRG